jgi:Arc/MetJ-type ribon-helix-helix transcriptional regulator
MSETEKITINLNVVDLGKIDLLVEEGFYTNRTDFIRSAIRSGLRENKRDIDATIITKNYLVGVTKLTIGSLERHLKIGKMMDLKTIGLVIIDGNVTPELAEQTIANITVKGRLKMSKEVRKRLESLGRIN